MVYIKKTINLITIILNFIKKLIHPISERIKFLDRKEKFEKSFEVIFLKIMKIKKGCNKCRSFHTKKINKYNKILEKYDVEKQYLFGSYIIKIYLDFLK